MQISNEVKFLKVFFRKLLILILQIYFNLWEIMRLPIIKSIIFY